MNSMMEYGWMMWGMGLPGVVGILVFILLVVALIGYLFFLRSKP